MTKKTNREGRQYHAVQMMPPDGEWDITLRQGEREVSEACDAEHKAATVEELHLRLDAMVAMDCE